MARQKPEPSEELFYLRKVMSQEHDADDESDVTLRRYRRLQNENPQFVFTQKMNAEEKYKAELEAWKKEKKEDKKGSAKPEDAPLEPCEVLVQRLIMEWKE